MPLLAVWFLLTPPAATAMYDPGLQRWINRDPIAERGFYFGVRPEFEYLHGWVLDYPFASNDPTTFYDPLGLWHVCCRLVRYNEGEGCLVAIGSEFIKHCDLRPSNQPCDNPKDTSYPVYKNKDPNKSLPGGKSCCYATAQEVTGCLKTHGTTAGQGVWGDNCQSSTREALEGCCAASTWPPDPYGYPVELPPNWPPAQ